MKARWDITLIIALGAAAFGYGMGKVNSSNLIQQQLISKDYSTNAAHETTSENNGDVSENNEYAKNISPHLKNEDLKKPAPSATPSEKEKLEAKNQLEKILKDSSMDTLLNSNILPGYLVSKATVDGENYNKEQLSDGSEANRWYRKNGTLIREETQYPSGEKRFRSFFDSGKIKTVQSTLKDGTIISLLLDSNGFILNRTIVSNHTVYTTEYDDYGNPIKTFWISPSGIGFPI